MIYWEYRIETPEPGLMRPRMKNQGDEIQVAERALHLLKMMGNDGWELCGIIESVLYVFKRERPGTIEDGFRKMDRNFAMPGRQF